MTDARHKFGRTGYWFVAMIKHAIHIQQYGGGRRLFAVLCNHRYSARFIFARLSF